MGRPKLPGRQTPKFGGKAYYRQVTAGLHPPAMFATPNEIVDTHNLADMVHYSDMKSPGLTRNQTRAEKNAVLEAKRNDFVGEVLADSVATHGYIDDTSGDPYRSIQLTAEDHLTYGGGPVRGPVVLGGHHRIALMHKEAPNDFRLIQTARSFSEATAPTQPPKPELVQGIHSARGHLNEIHALMQQVVPPQYATSLRDNVNDVHEALLGLHRVAGEVDRSRRHAFLNDAVAHLDNLAEGFPTNPSISAKVSGLQSHLEDMWNHVN